MLESIHIKRDTRAVVLFVPTLRGGRDCRYGPVGYSRLFESRCAKSTGTRRDANAESIPSRDDSVEQLKRMNRDSSLAARGAATARRAADAALMVAVIFLGGGH